MVITISMPEYAKGMILRLLLRYEIFLNYHSNNRSLENTL